MAAHAFPDKLDDYRAGDSPFAGTGRRVFFGIDSDGCVDRGMRYKHSGPFPRAGLMHFDLFPIAEPWRIAWTYVNEIAERGCPRYEGLAKTVDRVLRMPVVRQAEARGIVRIPRLPHLHDYLEHVASCHGYGDAVMQDTIDGLDGGECKDELASVLQWSHLVDRLVSSDCPYIEPFDNAIRTIRTAAARGADCMIVSGTPEDQLKDTWQQHGLTDCIRGVFGRESGKKDVLLEAALNAARAQHGRPYDIAIMFGDAPGDDRCRLQAAEKLGRRIAFMPIRAGHEEADWGWFADTILTDNQIDAYSEQLEADRIRAFRENLSRPWNSTADLTLLF